MASGRASGLKNLAKLNFMRINNTNSIPDRSGPGSTTTASAADSQGDTGNYATARHQRRRRGGKKRRERLEKKQRRRKDMKIGTLNVGSMTGKGHEIVDMMQRRKIDVLCVQETKWKGSKARFLGNGYKLYYHGQDNRRNGVGIILKGTYVERVLEIKRMSDRLISVKIEVEGEILNIVSAYAPQAGCSQEEKDSFWRDIDAVVREVPTGERCFIGADLNGHVGEGNWGDEEVLGRHGYGRRNEEGQGIVDFAIRAEMAVLNTYFKKGVEQHVTYRSGGRSSQVDYLLCRRRRMKEVSDCYVLGGESVAPQHRVVICKVSIVIKRRAKRPVKPRLKWWRLRDLQCRRRFNIEVMQAIGSENEVLSNWSQITGKIRDIAGSVLGVTKGGIRKDKETWWWNEAVQGSIKQKKEAKKAYDRTASEGDKREYRKSRAEAKREVAKAKEEAYKELYNRLNTKGGEKELFRIAKQRDKSAKDIQHVRVIKDEQGRLITDEEEVVQRWKGYFENLMNTENPREPRVEVAERNARDCERISNGEVRKAMRKMKSGKAVGPDDIPIEVWKGLGNFGVKLLTTLFNEILDREKMPDEWRQSVLIPVYKNKGDAQECGNYRGIKLMSHTMKLWERVMDARLREEIDICTQQYGFMPGKSTTDALFALRLLIEKYREGQKGLHCVFVDLEKAYDRVPREELWYCMRKAGASEKYVRLVQDMYENSRTAVRSAVGLTDWFEVKVGLHQGSALSPFLFAIVMDKLTEEVRREQPWNMLFADDIALCSETRQDAEEQLEEWREALEKRGMKVSRAKTEYMALNGRADDVIHMQGTQVKKVEEFKYLGSTVQSNGDCDREVKRRVQAGWNGWRKVTGVICDKKISAEAKGKVYKTVVRPALLFGLETVATSKKQEQELEVAEMRMLRWSLGVTRLDRIRNENIRGTAHVRRLGEKQREQRLRWFGHVMRRGENYVGRRMLDMNVPGRRKRGRPKRRYMDAVNEDLKAKGMRVADALDRAKWRRLIRCGDP